jgi:Ca2+-dependent lipid-binding protein
MPEIMKLQISLRATKLKNVAGAFKGTSDPFAVVTLLGANRGDKPKIVGKTEVIKNTLAPDWVTTFKVDYELGQPANLLIKIFDEVSIIKQKKNYRWRTRIYIKLC